MKKNALTFLFRLLIVFFASLIITRSLVWLLPGNPIDLILAESGTSLERSALSHQLGLDRSYFDSIKNSLSAIAQGNLGFSIHSREPVVTLIQTRLLTTVTLVGSTLFIALSLSTLLGAFAARPEKTLLTRIAYRVVSIFSIIGASSSSTWVGPLLLFLLTFKLPFFAISGSFTLAAITLSIPFIGFWSRLIRDRSREAYQHPSVTVAQSRGIGEIWIMLKYVLIPISGSLIAFVMTQIGHMLSGAFITEAIFNLNGMGSLLIEAVLKRDYPVIEGTIFCTSFLCIAFTLAGEVLQRTIDPRLADVEVAR